MRLLGNIIWFIFGGFLGGLSWWLAGLLWCITIIGIPIGKQCFKMASISFMPFGKEIVYHDTAVSFLVNVLWFLISGMELALGNLIMGCLFCITIVGIPFGLQYFKIAKLALAPFGAEIVKI
ncbi:MAG: YccF domain-containing protein [Lachnospiraceae bacterium]|nr:YccF domain-containing protein [Lachnospiraceae bacterium]